MKNRKGNNKSGWPGRLLYPVILIIAFVISTGASFFYLKDTFTFESEFIADIEARRDYAGDKGEEQDSRRLYGSGDSAPGRGAVLRKDSLLFAAEDEIRLIVKPYNMRLLDLYLDREGTMYIDFGDELKSSNIDVTEELKIIARLYSRMKETIPGLQALKILVEGSEAQSLGGHIDISKPIGEAIVSYIR